MLNVSTISNSTLQTNHLNINGTPGIENIARFNVSGDAASRSGPHMGVYFTGDTHPVFYQHNLEHNNISMNFDAYFDPSNGWKSASHTGNFQLLKELNTFKIRYAQSTIAGNLLEWQDGITATTAGKLLVGFALN